jgi:flavin reductase (DIM6/NTAB) family NADH-FMN oxidoreductase RutF|tara:strand:+ start:20424 stop:20900 length:477 start_codon:yes stop_codon:yes gene_type:complete
MAVQENREIRNAFSSFATGITVITALDGEKTPQGMTANSFSTVSLEPPLISWCVGQESRLFDLFQQASHFAVNILNNNQRSISELFSSSHNDKFSQVLWHAGAHDLPLLNDYACQFICATEHRYSGGDHIIIVGRVLDFSNNNVSPLIFHGGKYQALK